MNSLVPFPNLAGSNDMDGVEWLNAWDDELEVDDSDEVEDTNVDRTIHHKKPRRKPNRKRKYIFAPRVVKHDVRRFYGVMMANVFNSYNLDLLHSFYETYCNNLVHARRVTDGLTDKRDLYHNELLSNTMGLVTWSALIQQFSPDQTLCIRNMQIVTRSDSADAKIIVDLTYSCTNMYDWKLEDISDEMVAAACALASPSPSSSDGDQEGLPKIKMAYNEEDGEERLRETLGDMVIAVQTTRASTTSLSAPSSSASVSNSAANSSELITGTGEGIMRMLTPHVVINDQRKLRKPDVFGYYYRTRGKPVGLLPVPQKVEMPTRLVLYVNGQRQIVRMIFGADAMREDIPQ